MSHTVMPAPVRFDDGGEGEFTLAIFAAVQVAVPLWVRPHLIPPDRAIVTLESVQASWPSRWPWPGSASGGSTAGGPDPPGRRDQLTCAHVLRLTAA
jgi:hypothetical protein